MYYILYSSNKAREKNIKKIIRKRKYIHSAIHYLSKKKKNPQISGPTQFKLMLFNVSCTSQELKLNPVLMANPLNYLILVPFMLIMYICIYMYVYSNR